MTEDRARRVNTDNTPKPANVEALVAKLKQTVASTRQPNQKAYWDSWWTWPCRASFRSGGTSTNSVPYILSSKEKPERFTFGRTLVINDKLDRNEGEEAFYTMLRFTQRQFPLEPNFATPATRIHASPELLLEGVYGAWTKGCKCPRAVQAYARPFCYPLLPVKLSYRHDKRLELGC